MVVAIVSRQAAADLVERPLREDGDAVVALLAVYRAGIAARLELEGGEVLVEDLGLLQQRDVGLLFVEPFEQVRQEGLDRVDVPGDRKSVVSGKGGSVRVELGGRG